MRSRYSAYALGLHDYLLASWHPQTRPEQLPDEEPGTRWLGLRVLTHRVLGEDSAEVEFVARYRVGGGSAQRLQERSRFERIEGRWYYREGQWS